MGAGSAAAGCGGEDQVGGLAWVRDHHGVRGGLDLDRLGSHGWDMKRRLAVPIVLSAPAISDHDGIVFHAGGPDGSPSVARAAGRWAAAMMSVGACGRSAAKRVRNKLDWPVPSGASFPAGGGYGR